MYPNPNFGILSTKSDPASEVAVDSESEREDIMYNQTMFALAIFVCLYVCQSFQISSLFHRKLQTSNLKMASEASEQQYSFFVENNLNQGQAWKGLQAGYDPQDDEVEDYMYCEQLFDFMTPAQDEITQINTYVRGEIRADCEVCFDSEQVKSKEMPYKYKLGTLNGIKCCQNVDVRLGPTSRGLSMENNFRHKDGRIRILLAFSPIDFEGNVPVALGLTDIVIVRERLGRRPLKLDDKDGGYDEYWRQTSTESYDQLMTEGYLNSKVMYTYDCENNDALITAAEQITDLKLCHIPENEDNFVYQRVFPGGIKIEAQAIVLPGQTTEVKLSFVPSSQESTLYESSLAFTAIEPETDGVNDGMIKLKPPQLTYFQLTQYELKMPF